MRSYKAQIHLAGDRNHVTPRAAMSAAELRVLMQIHGSLSVQEVEEQPSLNKRMSHEELKEQLQTRYGRVRIGDGDDRRPVLRVAFQGWPNCDLPADAKEAGVPPQCMAGHLAGKQVEAAQAKEEALIAREEEIARQEAEFAEREAKLLKEREEFEAAVAEKRTPAPQETEGKTLTEMQKLTQQAQELGAGEDELKKANSKVKMAELIATLEAAKASGDSGDTDFME